METEEIKKEYETQEEMIEQIMHETNQKIEK